jgi:hypothetical protein
MQHTLSTKSRARPSYITPSDAYVIVSTFLRLQIARISLYTWALGECQDLTIVNITTELLLQRWTASINWDNKKHFENYFSNYIGCLYM